jgi:hypothetical protein
LSSPGEKSRTSEIKPDWRSASRQAALSLESRLYVNDVFIAVFLGVIKCCEPGRVPNLTLTRHEYLPLNKV